MLNIRGMSRSDQEVFLPIENVITRLHPPRDHRRKSCGPRTSSLTAFASTLPCIDVRSSAKFDDFPYLSQGIFVERHGHERRAHMMDELVLSELDDSRMLN